MRTALIAPVFGSILVLMPQAAGAEAQPAPQLPSSVMSNPDLPPNDDDMPKTAHGGEDTDLDPADHMQDDESDKLPHRRYMTRSSGTRPSASPEERENDE